PDVAHHARHDGDDLRGFDPPDRRDRVVGRRMHQACGGAAFGSMYTSSHTCPSGSTKPWPYMKPWSCGWRCARPPAATAFFTSESTSARLEHDRHVSTSVVFVASAMSVSMKVWKKGLTRSIAWMPSEITMHAPCSLLNCGLKLKPSASKKARVRAMSAMGRLTKIWRLIGWPPGSDAPRPR